MIAPPEAIEAVKAARHLVVFTGAGVSQESGIPTFRDAQTGLWERYDAEQLATMQAFKRDPGLVWGWYEYRRALVARCEPNAAHLAIAALAGHVQKLTVITQNVDDLHERAGTLDAIHLHGSLSAPRCAICSTPYRDLPDAMDEPEGGRHLMPPACPVCGGRIRPGVVWFGENLRQEDWDAAERAASTCDVLIAIGTSGMVQPAASLPLIAARHAAYVIQINPTPTELDRLAKVSIHNKAGVAMQDLMAKLALR